MEGQPQASIQAVLRRRPSNEEKAAKEARGVPETGNALHSVKEERMLEQGLHERSAI